MGSRCGETRDSAGHWIASALRWLCLRARRFGYALAMLGLVAAGLAADIAPGQLRLLESRHRGFEPVRNGIGVRNLFRFSLQATALGWRPDLVDRALALAEQMQDTDPESRSYGNFLWRWGEKRVGDDNAVEFVMQKGSLLWMLHREKLAPGSRERLERMIDLSVAGIRGHAVMESYTNIYLMKSWNCIALGEATDRPELAAEGYRMFDRWLRYTSQCGLREYLSPTYDGTALSSLGLVARFAGRPEIRVAAEQALTYCWTATAANWSEPCGRLGGAHSRDYDYLTGHGFLDNYLQWGGWIEIPEGRLPEQSSTVFMAASGWRPPDALRQLSLRTPRFVAQRWGPEPWEVARQYVGKSFSIGSAGSSIGPMDKVLTVNLAGGRSQPMLSFLMDARLDPYGKKRYSARPGAAHSKAHHLVPFVTSVQRGPEVLLLAAITPAEVAKAAPGSAGLYSHLVLPSSPSLWIGEASEARPAPGERRPVAPGQPVFLYEDGTAVGMRFALGTTGTEVAPRFEVVNDGGKHPVLRFTCVHADAAATALGVVAVWVRAAEGLGETEFATFRREFARANIHTHAEQTEWSVTVPGQSGPLHLLADLGSGSRALPGGNDSLSESLLLAVDGNDLGRSIFADIDRGLRERMPEEFASAAERHVHEVGARIEAEVSPRVIFQIGVDAAASGERFLWLPGEPGKGGSCTVARAEWQVRIPEAGDYGLWARVQTPTPSDDSFLITLRQGQRTVAPQRVWSPGVRAAWTWRFVGLGTGGQVRLQPGTLAIVVNGRETGAKLDALVLMPGGKAPAGATP